MITNGYNETKQQVLALYERYANLCKRAGKTADKSIAAEAKAIRDDVFNLMVLGEAKSGKSTFINAYLGYEVVPMDVRQCTSAIIKIHRGELPLLTAQEAGGGKQTIQGKDGIRTFLKEHAALSDQYREIPVTAINNELLIKSRNKKITASQIDEFIKQDDNGNVYKLDAKEYAGKIRKYIDNHANKWHKIITEIDITWPLPEAMQGITIVDSPGLNAGGSVGTATDNYIAKADAIIFTKSLVGQALESTSFKNLLEKHCGKHKRDCLFLVFTGKANTNVADAERLKEQAIHIFEKDICRDKMIFIDSKIQLFLNTCLDLGTKEKIDQYLDELEKTGNDFDKVNLCWLKSKGDIKLFEEKMEEISKFQAIHKALDKFARVAQYHKLAAFLNNLEAEYRRHEDKLNEFIKVTEQNIGDPAALEDCVKKKQSEIDDIKIKINKGIEEIYKKYTDPINGEGIIAKEIDKRKKEYFQIIDAFASANAADSSNAKANDTKAKAEKIAAEAEKKKADAKKYTAEADEKEAEASKIKAYALNSRAESKNLANKADNLTSEAVKLKNEAEMAMVKARNDSNRHKAFVSDLNYGATAEMKANAEKFSQSIIKEGEKKKAELLAEAEKKTKEANKIRKQAVEKRAEAVRQTKEAAELQKQADALNALRLTKMNESAQDTESFCESVTSTNDFSVMKKKTMDIIADTMVFREEIAKRIISDFNTHLIQYANNVCNISANIFKPNFTAADFDQINKNAAHNSLEMQDITEGKTFSNTEVRVPSYKLNKHVSAVANNIRSRLSAIIIPNMKTNLMNFINACRSEYTRKLNERLLELKGEYNQLIVDKDNNEKQILLCKNMKELCRLAKQALSDSEKLEKEINDYAAAKG